MRPTWVSRAIASFAFLPLLVALASHSQQPPSPSPEPTDPKALMMAAARLNSLVTPDVKPWHIKATYQTFDGTGAISDQGTFEEWWASPQKSKTVLSGKKVTETEYNTDYGDFSLASPSNGRFLLARIRNNIAHPLPDEKNVEQISYSSKDIQDGPLKLTCLTQSGLPYASSYCLATNEPLLRFYVEPSNSIQTLHNRLLRFQGRAIAGDEKEIRNGKVDLTIHLDTIEPVDPTDQSVFVAPPGADLVAIPHIVTIGERAAGGMLLSKVAPEYPPAAKIARISGTVVLQAHIGKDGRISDLKVISGPQVLQEAALDAARQWRYRPFLLNGQPVEVMTTIKVIFQLGQN